MLNNRALAEAPSARTLVIWLAHPQKNQMTSSVSIQLGVAKNHIDGATELYCQALQEKITPFLGPPERAAPFLASGLVADRAFVALAAGEVVGIAGFKLAGRDLFRPSLGSFFREYGLSAPLRLGALALLERKEEPDCLLMDGLAVAKSARGQGIGTRLLASIEAHAISLGKRSIRLDVIDTNPAARRLYERLGFVAEKTEDVGPLRVVLPFRQVTEMRKYLGP